MSNSYIILQIVKKYAFQKQKFRDDPNCDIDFETMRSDMDTAAFLFH